MQATKVVPQRVAAFIVDYLIITAFNFALFFAFASDEDEIRDKVLSGEVDLTTTTYGNFTIGDTEYAIVGGTFWIYFLIIAAVGIGYFWVLPGIKGWTPGKALLGLRVVRDDMSCPAGVGKNAIRSLLWIVDGFPYFIPNLVGFIVALTNKSNKRVGDIVAGTLVVKKEAVGQAPAAAGAAPGFTGSPALGAPPSLGQPGGGFAPQGAAPAAPAPAQPAPAAAQPAGWFPDPKGEKRLRYWDGQAWTDHTAD